MATAIKRGKSYKITVSCGYKPDGTQLRHHMTWTPTDGMSNKQIEKELERQKVLFEENIKNGIIPDSSIYFQDFAEKWLLEYACKELKLKTVTEYKKRLPQIYKAFGHIRMKDLRTEHLNAFYANLSETGIRADKKYVCKVDLLATLKERKMTRTAFAAASKISLQTVRSIADGNRIDKTSAAAVSKILETEISDIFTQQEPDRLLSPSTIYTYHRLISSCLGKAVKWKYMKENPAIQAELPRMRKAKAAYLDEPDARRLLELLHNEPIKYRAMVTLDLISGLRRGELLGLRWNDIDFKNDMIIVEQTSSYVPKKGVFVDTPKTASSARTLKLSHSVFPVLLDYKHWQDMQREACGDAWKDKDNRVFT
ncbi:MAG: site-specific integrase, partial [Clostridiales bacterium]|nr:site-specific integrase [Clostridiales bacterium]